LAIRRGNVAPIALDLIIAVAGNGVSGKGCHDGQG
jgi:hypothetical protein